MTRCIDSSIVFYQKLLVTLKEEDLELKKNRQQFDQFSTNMEEKIKIEIDKVNTLGEEGRISKAQVDSMFQVLNSSLVFTYYKEVKQTLDSLENTY